MLIDGKDAAGQNAEVRPLEPARNIRVRLKGTCNPGDRMTHAAVNGTDDGKCRALPAAAGTYFVLGLAEEAGVDDQLVRIRPTNEGLVTVT